MLRDPSLIPLSHQHHNGLSLCVLTERDLRADSSPEVVARLARRVIDRYELELTNHFEIEEKILFPAAAESPLVEALIAEHRELSAMIDGLRREPSASALRAFTALLRSHIRLEENDLFEDVQRRLPREALDLLGRQINEKVVRICL